MSANLLTYSTRANLIALPPSLIDGEVVIAAGIEYEKQDSSTAIPDLPKFVPANSATPQHWGAKGENSTDDSAAFQAMFDWVMGGGGNWRGVYIPAGHYVIEQQITSTADTHNSSSEYGLFVRGDGASTVIVNANSDGFFSWIQASARDIRVYFKDFSIMIANPYGPSASTPIQH